MIPYNRNHSVVAESLFSCAPGAEEKPFRRSPSNHAAPSSLTPPTGHISTLHFLQMISSVHFDHSQLFWGLVGDRPLSLSLSPPPQTVCGSPVPALPAEPGGFLLRAGHKHRAGVFQTLPTTVPALRDYRQSPAGLLGDPAQSLESTGHQALGAPSAPALLSLTWLFNKNQKFILKFLFQALPERDEIPAMLHQHQVPSPCSLPGRG